MPTSRAHNVNAITPTLEIESWHDPVIDHGAHDPRSDYANTFWLPILGPSAMAVARKLMEHIERHPDGNELVVADLACAVGLAGRLYDGTPGRNSRIVATLLRLHQFGLAQHHARGQRPGLYRVRVTWPPLTMRQAERLPRSVLERLEAA